MITIKENNIGTSVGWLLLNDSYALYNAKRSQKNLWKRLNKKPFISMIIGFNKSVKLTGFSIFFKSHINIS